MADATRHVTFDSCSGLTSLPPVGLYVLPVSIINLIVSHIQMIVSSCLKLRHLPVNKQHVVSRL